MTGSGKIQIISAGRIISEDANLSGPCSLVLSDGKIEKMHSGHLSIPHSEVIDFGGYAITPVFCDYHIHLPSLDRTKLKGAVSALAGQGIFSVFEGGDRAGRGLDLKNALSGHMQVRAAGYALYMSGTYGKFIGKPVVTISDAIKLVDDLKHQGADYLKIINSGIYDPEKDRITAGGFPAEMLDAVVRHASQAGLEVWCHANGVNAVSAAVKAGVSAVIHGLGVNERTLDLMAERNTAFVPTVCAFRSLIKRVHTAAAEYNLMKVVDSHKSIVIKAFERGLRVLPGSDAGPDFIPYGLSYIEELELLMSSGIPYEDVIRFSAADPLREGMNADFLLLDGLEVKSVFRGGIILP